MVTCLSPLGTSVGKIGRREGAVINPPEARLGGLWLSQRAFSFSCNELNAMAGKQKKEKSSSRCHKNS